jgi:hypothetical protein
MNRDHEKLSNNGINNNPNDSGPDEELQFLMDGHDNNQGNDNQGNNYYTPPPTEEQRPENATPASSTITLNFIYSNPRADAAKKAKADAESKDKADAESKDKAEAEKKAATTIQSIVRGNASRKKADALAYSAYVEKNENVLLRMFRPDWLRETTPKWRSETTPNKKLETMCPKNA